MVTELEQLLDVYNVGGACQLLREHLEVLTNWYIRRSRSRFWAGEPDALDTLWTVLETVCRAAAPLLPLTTEAIWRGLTGEPSVHLAAWPDVSGWAVPDSGPIPGTSDLTGGHGPGPGGVQHRARPAQGAPAAGPAAAGVAGRRAPRGQVAGPVHRPDRRRGQRQDRRAVRRRGQPGHVRAGRQPAAARAPARRPGAAGHPGGQGGRLGAVRGARHRRRDRAANPASTSCGWPPRTPAPPRPCRATPA